MNPELETKPNEFDGMFTDDKMIELHKELNVVKEQLADILSASLIRTKEVMPSVKGVPFEQLLDALMWGVAGDVFNMTMDKLDPTFAEKAEQEIDDAILAMAPTSKTVH
jgi:hypothetical protein